MTNFYFFYKHRLSQWHLVDIEYGNFKYNCCEQGMMHQKALLFNDLETANEILNTKNPWEHQKLGRKIKNFNQEIWDSNKYSIVLNINRARFNQSKSCRELLLSTGNKELCESSPIDCVWGCGLSADNPLIMDKKNWRGENLLGKILTHVRNEINGL